MKFLDLEPTEENVVDQFCIDSIDRNNDIAQFVSLLNSIDESCSISVDALWGAGKTFFVKQVKMILDAYNSFVTSVSDETKNRIKVAWENICVIQKTTLQPQVCVYFDAWENDNDEEPVLSLVHSIMQETQSDFSFKNSSNIIEIIASLAEAISGRQLKQLAESMKQEDYLETIKKNKDIRTLVEEFLESLLPEKGNRLVIIIDELDRCRPDFAVRLLERAKHFFSNERITFVFSINSHQLQHTIRHYYGEGFDASRYLDRFFDLSIELPPANMSAFYQSIGLENGSGVYESFCKEIAKSFNMQMRDTARFYNMAKIATYRPTHSSNQACFMEEKGNLFCTMLLTPFLIALKMRNRDLYQKFVSGENGNIIGEVIKPTDVARSYKNWMLTKNETFDNQFETDNKEIVDFKQRISEVYYAIFQYDFALSYRYDVGQMTFTKRTKQDLLRIVSGLSMDADYSL